MPQSVGAVEYTSCKSAEGKDFSNECPGYDRKQFDSEVPALGNAEYSFIAIAPWSIMAQSGST